MGAYSSRDAAHSGSLCRSTWSCSGLSPNLTFKFKVVAQYTNGQPITSAASNPVGPICHSSWAAGFEPQVWCSGMVPALTLQGLGLCGAASRLLQEQLSDQSIWRTAFELHVKPRWGNPKQPPESWRDLCRRCFLRSVAVDVNVGVPGADDPWVDMHCRFPVEMVSRIGVPPLEDGVDLHNSYVIIHSWHMSRAQFDMSRDKLRHLVEPEIDPVIADGLALYKREAIEEWLGQRIADIPNGGDDAFELQVLYMSKHG